MRTRATAAMSQRAKQESSGTKDRVCGLVSAIRAMLSALCTATHVSPLAQPKKAAATTKNSSRKKGMCRAFTAWLTSMFSAPHTAPMASCAGILAWKNGFSTGS
ncbi:MAG: hypothetical protein IJU95_07255 [Treponema sp.]|nr:hypothetical protein [Treponema sp.]